MLHGHPSPKPTICWSNMGEIQLLDMGSLKKEVREERTSLKTTRCYSQKLRLHDQSSHVCELACSFWWNLFDTIDSYSAPMLLVTKVSTQMVKARLGFKALLIYQVARTLTQSMFNVFAGISRYSSKTKWPELDPIGPFSNKRSPSTDILNDIHKANLYLMLQ